MNKKITISKFKKQTNIKAAFGICRTNYSVSSTEMKQAIKKQGAKKAKIVTFPKKSSKLA